MAGHPQDPAGAVLPLVNIPAALNSMAGQVIEFPKAAAAPVANPKDSGGVRDGVLSLDKARRQKLREAARHAKLMENLAKRRPDLFGPGARGVS